jgi:hypothetical protein
VTEALLLMLGKIKNETAELSALDSLNFVFSEYPSFLESPEIIPLLKESTLSLLRNCFDNNFRVGYEQYCTPFFINHFNKLPQDPNYLSEAGEYIRRSGGNAESLIFFEKSVHLDNSHHQCSHAGLYTAADWAIRLPSTKENLTRLGMKIMFHHCWDHFKDELIEDSIYGDDVYLNNICSGLKEKQIRLPKDSKCQNTKT